MCKFQIDEDKANAHAGMPFCGVSRFVVPVLCWYGQQPFRGVGRLCLSSIGMHSLTLVNATTRAFFVFSQNLAKFFAERSGLQGN
jgi:hypothetical protein